MELAPILPSVSELEAKLQIRNYKKQASNEELEIKLGKGKVMDKKWQKTLWEMLVAALTALLTALTTTSCAGYGPF